MSDPTSKDSKSLSTTILGQIELICDRFESAWRGEAKPRIEDYWREADGPDLLRELLVLELAYRIKRHDHPHPAEYQRRFAAHANVIRSAFETVPARHRSPRQPSPAASRSSADRNLLFGVLAMQMDFVTREALIAAVSAWVLDKSKSLDRILVEQGGLATDERDLLEPLIQKHLERHGGDPAQSLASLGSRGLAREALGRVADPELDASLALLNGSNPTDLTTDFPQSIRLVPENPGAQRFHVLRPLARGGLGEVFVARDTELRREVALKLIQEQHASDRDSRTRFEFEAEITGRLEHPGVIPVYGLGVDARDRPYYAMRFVRGESLKEAIAGFHREDGPTRQAGERSLGFRELLGRFVDVCNTIAYAHGRGILHRDLKPANIMLGPYGETLVVDWGLAKVAGRADGEPSTADASLRLRRASAGASTEPGSWLGTPSYMSPEQAAGRIDQLGPASDIYSLGATLYNLLTGKTAFEGTDVFVLLGKIRAGDFPPPRSVDSTIDRALESVCLKAMALAPEDRYPSCRELADDLKRWAADEPVSAWQEPLGRRVRRWAKRNRTSMTGAAVALVAGVVGLSAVLAVQTRAKAALAASLTREKSASTALAESNTDLTRSRAAVQARYNLAMDAILTFHTGVSEDFLLKEEKFQELRNRLLTSASEFYGRLGGLLGKETDPASLRALAQANFELAELTNKVGRAEDALAAHRQALAVREALAARSEADPEIKAEVGRSLTAIASLLGYTGKTNEAEVTYHKAETLLAELLPTVSGASAVRRALAECRSSFGYLLERAGRLDEALLLYRLTRADLEAMAAEPGATADLRRKLAITVTRTGSVLRVTGKPLEAEAELRKALALRQKLVDDSPNDVGLRSDLAHTHTHLGLVMYNTGRLSETLAEWREALALAEKVAGDSPAVTQFRSAVAELHSNLVVVLANMGKPAEAEIENRKALALRQKLADDNPAVTRFQRDLADSYNNLAQMLERKGKLVEAAAELRHSLAIKQKLADDNPKVPEYREGVAMILCNLGEVAHMLGREAEARDNYERAIAVGERLVAENPTTTIYRSNVAHSLHERGLARRALGDHAGAVADARRALGLYEGLPSRSAHEWFETACCHAALASLAGLDGAEVSAAEGAAEADLAMGLTRKAVGMGYRDNDAFRTEPALDTLRNRPDFRVLMMDLVFPTKPFAQGQRPHEGTQQPVPEASTGSKK